MGKAVLTILLALFFSLGCLGGTEQTKSKETTGGSQPSIDWKDIELTDIATSKKFKISDFAGKSVLLESFAVWCPSCLKQQNEIKNLRQTKNDGDIVYISIDTDPNEDEEKVRKHIESNGFDWYYAISPIELTNALIDEFGLGVVNAPTEPIILICKDQSTRFLRNGHKTSEDIISEVEKGC